MRLLFAIIGLLLPQALWAQFLNSFEPGSYRLVNSPGVRHQSLLKLRDNDQLVAKNDHDNKVKLTPQEVASFQIGERKYITAGNFELSSGPFDTTVDLTFVERLDSSYVSLLRYTYFTGVGPNGSGCTDVLYLLKWVQETGFSSIPSGGLLSDIKFREALQRHLANWPD